MTNSRAPRFRVLSVAIATVAVVSVIISLGLAPVRPSLLLGALALLVVTAEALAVDLPHGGSMSLSYPVTIAVLLLYGPSAGAVVAACSGVSVDDVRKHKPPSVVVYNIAQLTLSALVSGWLYQLLGGEALLVRPLQAEAFPLALVPLVVMATTSFLMNALLVSIGISVYTGTPFRRVFTTSFSWVMPTQLALAALGLAIAQVVAQGALAGLLLFVFPLIIARQLYQRYVGLRDAYLDTVRSLVAAIEAKDPYTRGHSERVADFAVKLSEALELSESQVERIEFSALLHDLGKIGISSRVLAKSARLTDSEFDEIRRHPTIGASILASVPYLSDVVPAVVSHHERFDGNGYSAGLAKDAVPLEARILAVADAWDAMTSERPYRPALTHEQALRELRAQAGKQFDPELVGKFTSVVDPTAGITAIDLNLVSTPGGPDG